MHVTLTIYPDESLDDILVTIEIFPDMPISTLKELVQAQTSIDASTLQMYHSGQLLADNSKTMEQQGISDGDVIVAHVVARPPPQQPAALPGRDQALSSQAEAVRQSLAADPELRRRIQLSNPSMAAVLDDPQAFAQHFESLNNSRLVERQAREMEINRLNADPFDPENQARIAEIIRQQGVAQNLQDALEHTPEVFGRVIMLYIMVEVNGHKVKALVDSGAETTIMSPGCAEACNIMHLVDKRYEGVARGVGTAKIIGRVHSAPIRIGTVHLPSSFTVMEGKAVDLLLGLDMLKRYQAVIDLVKDKLIIHGEEISFLSEAEIPKRTEEERTDEQIVPGPGDTGIGSKTGTLVSTTGEGSSSDGGPPPAPPISSSSTPAQRPSAPPLSHDTQAKVEQLISMGASREQAEHALQASNGDIEAAAGYIFFGS